VVGDRVDYRSAVTIRTVLRAAAVTGATFGVVLLGSPAFAAHRDDGDDPGKGLSALETLLIFGVIPVALFLLIALLVSAPSIARGPRYRADRGWQGPPLVFGAPRDLQLPSGSTMSGGQAIEAAPGDSTSEPASEGGGASARW
jgi:hypothetical protein